MSSNPELGTPIEDAFKTPSTPPAPAKKPVEKPLRLGTPIEAAFKDSTPKPSKLSGLLQEVKVGGKAALSKLDDLGRRAAAGLNPADDQMIRSYTLDAVAQLKKDFKASPQEGGPLQGAKVALDVLNTIWAPLQASIDEDISSPMKASIQKIANHLAKHTGPNSDAVKDVESFEQLVDPALTALQLVLPGPKALEASRDTSMLRNASAGLREAVEPTVVKPVTIALDKTMGFKGIDENLTPILKKLPVGTKVNAKLLIGQMLPHAQGYARKFLEKLQEHMDDKVHVEFSNQAGSSAESFGVYWPGLHKITVKQEVPDLIHTVLHEMYHATTVNVIDSIMDGELKAAEARKGAKLSEGEISKIAYNPKNPVLRELGKIITETRLRWNKAGLGKELWQKVGYGVQAELPRTDPAYAKLSYWEKPLQAQIKRYEFLAEMFTNPHLQEFMANSEKYASKGYKFKNMLQQFGLMIGKHLGLDKPHDLQLLNQALSVGSRLMRMQTEGEVTKYRDFKDIVVAHLEDGDVITRGEMEAATGLKSEVRMEDEVGKRRNEKRLQDFHDSLMKSVKDRQSARPVEIEALGHKYNVGDRVPSKNGPVTIIAKTSSTYSKDIMEAVKAGDFKKARELRKTSPELPAYLVKSADGSTTSTMMEWGMEHNFGGPKPLEVLKKGTRQTAAEAKNSLQLTIEGILRTVNPEALGKNAKLAASVVASRIAEEMQRTASWRYGAKTRQNFWRARPDLAKEFINKFEAGGEFNDPDLTRLARKYRDWNARIAARESELGFKYEPRENYLYHLFTDSEGVSNYFERKYGSKWGDPKFIKERAFNMYKEAIAAGFTPVYDNPEDIMLARQQASDLAEMHIGILNDLASYGMATRKIEAKTKAVIKVGPEGKATLDFEKTEANKRPENTTRYRAPNGDVFWVDNQAAMILDNAFKSKSLWADKTLLGKGFRGMMTAKNLIVPVRLSLSLFHPLHIVGIDIASTMTRQMVGMLSGEVNPLVGMAKILKSGFDPFYANPKIGWRVMRAMRGQIAKEALNASDTEALQHLVDGGLILDMSPQYRTNARQNFFNAWVDAHADFRMRKPGALAWDVTRATWHAPWALLSAVQKPIFEDWIPMLKGASYLQDVKALLERNPDLVEDRAARQLALRKLAKSAENRYGEMAYNTLFWKRWFKDLAVLNTLSLGWQMGFLREYGGGAMDLGQFTRSSDKMQRVREGLLDRPLFVASYTTLGGAMAGLMTYGFTGKPPSSLLDYIDPQVGGQNPDGTPKRISTMFYSREFASLYKHVQDQGVVGGISSLVSNKGSGLFGLMHEWYSGVNDFGEDIRDPNSNAFKQTEETLAYTLADMEPISISSLRQQAEQSTTKDKALAALGFTPAPKYITETRSEALISQAYDKYVAPKETPFDKAEYSKEFRKLEKQYQSGDPGYGDTLDAMADKYQLSSKDIRRVIRTLNMNLPSSVKMFIQLPWQQQKAILDKMPAEERELYLLHANKEHVRNTYEAPQ